MATPTPTPTPVRTREKFRVCWQRRGVRRGIALAAIGGGLVIGCEFADSLGDDGAVLAVASVSDPAIREASGLVASRQHADCYYIHNDSGSMPMVYLIDRSGATRATVFLNGAANRDWEDIAIVPPRSAGEPAEVCLADIGDNFSRHAELRLYCLAEPPKVAAAAATPRIITFRLSDGPRDAEGFAIHPRTRTGYLFTKQINGATRVYRLAQPWDGAAPLTADFVTELRLPGLLPTQNVITAADIAPDGRRLALRAYTGGWELRLPDELDAVADFERIFEQSPRFVRLADEAQGEALCYSADGLSLLTISEGGFPTLYERAAP